MERIPELYKYRHISFDLWLTLIKSNPQFKSKRDILFKDFFSIDKSIEEVSGVIRKFDVLTNSINEKVGRNFDTFEIYYLILNALDVNIETIAADELTVFYKETELLFNEYKPILLSETIPERLTEINREGITMNILSNTAFIKGSTLRGIISHYGMGELFAFQAYSDETGFSKPNAEMYNYAYDTILKIGDIQKNEILHVGDNPVSDYNGAKNFGFNAFLITNNHNEPNLQPA